MKKEVLLVLLSISMFNCRFGSIKYGEIKYIELETIGNSDTNLTNRYSYHSGIACNSEIFSVTKNSINIAFEEARKKAIELEYVEIEEIDTTFWVVARNKCPKASNGSVKLYLRGLKCENCN